VRKVIAALAILAVVFVVGCQDTKKVTELQGQVDRQTQQITAFQGQITQLTAERDSLQKIITDAMAKGGKIQMPGAQQPGTKTGGTTPPTGGKKSSGKPPKVGR